MKHIVFLICLISSFGIHHSAFAAPPHIVFIAVDDLNDWVGCLGGHPDVKTPHMDQLAARGLLFTNAHCQVPVCMASRVSVFSGRHATTTGCYDFNAEFHEAATLHDAVPIPLHFKNHGYTTLGGGKLLHRGFQGRLEETFDTDLTDGRNPAPPQTLNWPDKSWDYGAFPQRDDEMGDYRLAQKAAAFLRQKQERPFFLAVGFHRPHVPLLVPQMWFDLYDKATLTLPKAPLEDLADLPVKNVTRQQTIAPSHDEVLAAGKWRDFVHAYLACISFVDHCIGEVADAALDGPNADNTLIVLWSDHGFHLGEKHYWAKRTLWEESTRVPLIFAGKGIPTGARCAATVGLVDLYPTLTDLAGLPAPHSFDGTSLAPLITDPSKPWPHATLSTWLPGNHVVIQDHWRYIRYQEGHEELYDMRSDADQFTNLAADPAQSETKTRLSKHLPTIEAPLTKAVTTKKRRKP